jgi:hypothetical protein
MADQGTYLSMSGFRFAASGRIFLRFGQSSVDQARVFLIATSVVQQLLLTLCTARYGASGGLNGSIVSVVWNSRFLDDPAPLSANLAPAGSRVTVQSQPGVNAHPELGRLKRYGDPASAA